MLKIVLTTTILVLSPFATLLADIQSANANCIDTDGDSWGWDGVKSCLVETPTAGACIDTDGDGWGWDGVMSCLVEAPAAGECIDSDGDGWGWNGVKSCIPSYVGDPVEPRDDSGYTQGQITRVIEGNSLFPLWNVSFSSDARFVLFNSWNANEVASDTNSVPDVFLKDTFNNTVSRVNLGTENEEANNQSYDTSISADGRYLLFGSYATNLASGVTNGSRQIHRYDNQTKTMQLVSVNDAGEQGRGDSYDGLISDDGRYVAFASAASNFFDGDRNRSSDVFQHDVETGVTKKISNDYSGGETNGISHLYDMTPDGRYILFWSDAADMTFDRDQTDYRARVRELYVHDTFTSSITRVAGGGKVRAAAISDDGQYVTWESERTYYTNGGSNVASYNQVNWSRLGDSIISVGWHSRNDYNPDISPDGRYVVWESRRTFNNSEGTASRTLYSRDMFSVESTPVALTTTIDGLDADENSEDPHFTPDGAHISFRSLASNLIESDNNNIDDIFVLRLFP